MELSRNVTVIPARRRSGEYGQSAGKAEIGGSRLLVFRRIIEQATSYDAQVAHYTQFIEKNSEWELAGIFADISISGTNTKKREIIV